jgi:alkylated DNA repair dioxygenase AlkB
MGYHADDEATLDHTAPIASVSFGVTRSFDIRPRKKMSDGKKSRLARISLGDGDLLVMLSPMQEHYEHAIPVEKRVSGERINLTFRRIRA